MVKHWDIGWIGNEQEDEYFLQGKHDYIFMRGCIYNGRVKKVIRYDELTKQDLIAIWESNWATPPERRRVIMHYGQIGLFKRAKRVYFAYKYPS